MRQKIRLPLAVVLACLAYCTNGFAKQKLDEAGTVVVGVDRLFGLVHYASSYRTPNDLTGGFDQHQDHVTNLSLMGRNGAAFPYTYLQLPRVGVDVVIGLGLTVGGAFVYDYGSLGGTTNGRADNSRATITNWQLFPRAGFVKMLTEAVGIWSRVGILYLHFSESDQSSQVASRTFVEAAADLVFVPVPHVGITVGPTLLYQIASSNLDNGYTSNNRLGAFGIQTGLTVWF